MPFSLPSTKQGVATSWRDTTSLTKDNTHTQTAPKWGNKEGELGSLYSHTFSIPHGSFNTADIIEIKRPDLGQADTSFNRRE